VPAPRPLPGGLGLVLRHGPGLGRRRLDGDRDDPHRTPDPGSRDRRRPHESRPYGFWLHAVAGLTIGGGLLWFFHDGTFEWILVAVVVVAYMAIGDGLAVQLDR